MKCLLFRCPFEELATGYDRCIAIAFQFCILSALLWKNHSDTYTARQDARFALFHQFHDFDTQYVQTLAQSALQTSV